MTASSIVTAAARRRFLRQMGVMAAAPVLLRSAHAQRSNPPALLAVEAGHYRFLPAGQVFCAGVLPDEGHEVVHALLNPWLPLAAGYTFIENYLRTLGLPMQALCGMELRVPQQMTFDAFRAFNAPYIEQLRKWDLVRGNYSAVCRTNVAPGTNPPGEASIHAFSYVAPAGRSARTFCVSGTADIDPRGSIIAAGDVSPAGMKTKLGFVFGVIGGRLAELELEWSDATHVDLYLVADVPQIWTTMLTPLGGAASRGVRLHNARPPIVDAEVELEARGVAAELTLRT
ncbi:MAG TPA: hypothetical protein VML56_07515 [Burkholderiales bacterium]|nr:hypothetical protein [Burkholderiales bacterium]